MTTEPEDPKPHWPTEEHWKTLGLQQRWTLVVLTVQATAALGTLIAAIVGVWSVSPIINYRIQQQERRQQMEESAVTLPDTHPVTARFVQDVYSWWEANVESYERVLEVIRARDELGLSIAYEVLESPQLEGVAESLSDVLVLTATGRDGKAQVVEVHVNENAMPLTQYIQYKINHGAFSELDAAKRQKVEAAVTQYMKFYMVPRVPPPYVGAKMSLDEVEREIDASQKLRVDAMKHIQALNAVIEVALLG